MSYITKNHKQDIVYWGNPSPDGFGGNTFASPIVIKGRWEDNNKQFINAQGEEIISRAIVYLGQDVDINGFLFLGTLPDVGSANQDDPERVSGAYEIKAFRKIPNLKGTEFERKVFL